MSAPEKNPALVYAEAEATHFAKLLLELRDKLALFVDDIEDEGDRVYFGSTNQADYLRETEAKLRYLDFERADMAAKKPDLFADLRGVRENLRLIEADYAALKEHVTHLVYAINRGYFGEVPGLRDSAFVEPLRDFANLGFEPVCSSAPLAAAGGL